jgi:hypothetical protein
MTTGLPIAVLEDIKSKFLDGRSLRSISQAHNLNRPQVMQAVNFLAREFDFERSLRVDRICGSLARSMEHVSTLLEVAYKETPKSHELLVGARELLDQYKTLQTQFVALSKQKQEYELGVKRRKHPTRRPRGPDGKITRIPAGGAVTEPDEGEEGESAMESFLGALDGSEPTEPAD